MRERSFGVITLAFMSVMVALYAQMGAIALILGGSFYTTLGSMQGAATLLLGALFLGLAVASYAVGYAVWTGKHWSWAGSAAMFGTLILASILLSLLAATPLAAPLPITAAAIGLVLINRPGLKAELLGAPAPTTNPAAVGERMETAEAAN